MSKIKVYSADYCPYCDRAKRLLESKGAAYEEIRVDLNPDEKDRIIQLTGMKTIPQIFINEEFVGGYAELKALDDSGELDKKL